MKKLTENSKNVKNGSPYKTDGHSDEVVCPLKYALWPPAWVKYYPENMIIIYIFIHFVLQCSKKKDSQCHMKVLTGEQI